MGINSLTLAVLVTAVAAIPHHRHAHPHPVRRDVDVVTTSVVVNEMAVLWVDQNGNRLATSVQPVDAAPTDPAVDAAGGSPWGQQPSAYSNPNDESPYPMPTPSSEDSNSQAPSAPAPETTQAPPPSSDSTPDASSSTPPQSASPNYDDGEVIGYSIAYAPYHSDHSCKTEDEVNKDVDGLHKYGMIRIYGTDCDQVRIVMDAAKRNDMKVFLGIWDVTNAAAEAQLIIDGAKDDWGRVHTVSVGNEVIASGRGTVSQVVDGINTAKPMLRSAGFQSSVTTVDVWITLIEYLVQFSNGLCDSVDYIAANLHPFFDGEVTAEEAGQWVSDKAKTISANCTKPVVVTESGWPSKGEANGVAVPGPQNQRTVITGLQNAYAERKEELVLFSAYNDAWKDDNKWNVEHYWGIYNDAPSAR